MTKSFWHQKHGIDANTRDTIKNKERLRMMFVCMRLFLKRQFTRACRESFDVKANLTLVMFTLKHV